MVMVMMMMVTVLMMINAVVNGGDWPLKDNRCRLRRQNSSHVFVS